MEYLPDTLSRIIKGNLPYHTHLSPQKVRAITKCLVVALKDLHVREVRSRVRVYVIAISNLQMY